MSTTQMLLSLFPHALNTLLACLAALGVALLGMVLAARIAVLWYFKLDRIERHLSEIVRELKNKGSINL